MKQRSADAGRNKKLVVMAVVLSALFLLVFVVHVFDGGNVRPPSFPRDTLVLQKAGGEKISLNVEVATSLLQKAYGLMYRRSLPAHSGMLFLWSNDLVVTMWMKNTYIPLDMLFVRSDGTIEKILADAVPHDLTPLSSGEPVRAVIELNAGSARNYGLRVGDKALYPAFGNAETTGR